MMEQSVKIESARSTKTVVLLFLGMLVYKITIDLSHWIVLMRYEPNVYISDFSLIKYILGFLWCVILFFGIRHTQYRVSTFLLYLMYLLQIIPITTVYGLSNENSLYYHVICLGFLLCELIVGYTLDRPIFERNTFVSQTMCICFAAAAALVVGVCIAKNGVPSLTALNIYDVYELRSSGAFQLSKYLNYILAWTMKVIFPIFIAKTLVEKKYGLSLFLCGLIFLIYLYSGHKAYLFSVPVVVLCTLWAKRKNFYKELFMAASCGCGLLNLLTCAFPAQGGIIYRVYSLFVRRCILDSANTKFFYYDYFTKNPKMGLGGMFPRWLIQVNNPYADIDFQHEIGRIYFNAPEMNANTGFLAEGYMRFGHLGTILVLVVLALLLKQMDRLQERTGYPLVVGMFAYPVFSLADAHLLDSFVIGPWMISLFILLFYKERQIVTKEYFLEHQIKSSKVT